MRERVGKKQLRLPARSLLSLACGGLHFEGRSDHVGVGQNIACHNLILYVLGNK